MHVTVIIVSFGQFFIYVIVRRITRKWGLPTETITHEEFYANNDIEPKNEISHDEW